MTSQSGPHSRSGVIPKEKLENQLLTTLYFENGINVLAVFDNENIFFSI